MKLTYVVRKPPEEVAQELQAKVDAPGAIYRMLPGTTTGRAVVGQVTTEGFELGIRRRNYNSLAPRARGRVRRITTGSEIEVEVGASPTIRKALALLLVLIGFSAAPPLAAVGYPTYLVLAVVASLFAVGTYVARSTRFDSGFPSRESEQLRDFLDSCFGSPDWA